jgi:PAS domain S-box-containing protein
MAGSIQVLCVDDEPDLLEIAKLFLEEGGEFSVSTATSAPEALDHLGRDRYDAIVSDFQMPKMDGIELLKRVRAVNKTIPFILFTGRGREEVVIDALNNGADFYVQKGGDAEAQFMELGHKIRKTVLMRRNEQSLAENRDYLDQIFSSVQSGIVIIDATTHEILDLNPAAEKMIGTTKDQVAGNVCHRYICPSEEGRCPITDLHQKMDNSERVLLAADGRKINIIKYVVPFNFRGRECLLETFHDNTERKLAADELHAALAKVTAAEEELRQNYDHLSRTEQAVRENESRFRTIFDNSPYPIAINSHPDMKFLEVNAEFLKASGYAENEVLGKNPVEMGLISVTEAARLVAHRLLKGKVENVPLALVAQGGRRIHVLFTSIPVTINNAPATLTVTAEVTSLKRVEEQLLQKNEDLTAAYEELAATKEELQENYDALTSRELELRESEEKFRSLVETTPNIIWEMDMEGRFRYLSPMVTTLTGYIPEELVGKTVIDLTPEELRSQVTQELERIFSSAGPLIPFEIPARHRDGHDLILGIHPSRITDANGTVTGLRGMAADITGRRQAEDKVRESGKLFRAVFDNANDAMTLVENAPDGPGKYVLVNDKTIQLLGYSRDELLQKSPRDLVPAEIMEKVRPDARRKIFGAGDAIFESVYRKKDGSKVPVEVSIHRFSYQGKDVSHGIIRDITERKRAEDKERESSERYRLILQNANDGILVNELTAKGPGKFIEVNDQACRILGMTPGEMQDVSLTDLDTPEMRQRAPEIMRTILRDRHAVFQTGFRARDGQEKSIDISVSLFDLNGRPTMLSVVRDITEARATEAAVHTILAAMVGTTGMESLDRITENIRAWIGADYVMVGEIQPDGTTVKVLSMRLDGNDIPGLTYTLKGTPCENAAEKGFCAYPDNVRLLFPEAKDLADFDIRGYVGTSLRNSAGNTIGILCAMTHAPLRPVPAMKEIMEIIATKAAAEIERTAIERSLRDNQQLLAEAMDLAHLANWEYDTGSDSFTFDDHFADLCGMTQENPGGNRMAAGTYFTGYVHQDDRGIVEEEVKKALATTDPRYVSQWVHRIIRGNGEIRYTEVYIGITLDGEGRTIRIHGVNQDITGRRQAEEALRQANRKLNLLSGITRHDINNQLLTLNGFAGLLRKKITDPGLEDYLSRITRSSSQISAMIRFTREYEQVGVHLPVWQDLQMLVNDAGKNATLGSIALNNDLPAGTEVYADPLITRVFFNLIDNAVRHGGKITTIRFALESRNGDRVIVCEDDGDGVASAIKERIFDRGFGKNTGFGLTITREILDITGIAIHETGDPAKGARFEIVVPQGTWRTSR